MKQSTLSLSIEEELASIRESKKTVDEWLGGVDYSASEPYVPSLFAFDVVNFIKLVHGIEGTANKTPEVHFKVLDNFVTDKSFVANMMHRGFGKSTLITYLIFYLAVYGKLPNFGSVDFMIYVSDSMDNGVSVMRKNLDYIYDNSEFLQSVLVKSTTEARWVFTNADRHTLVVKGYGAKSGIRGTREQNKRPQIAILDDLLSDEDARSPTVLRGIKDTINKAIEHALDPQHKKVFWMGTPFNANDPLYEAVESGAWEVNVYPVCEVFPCTEAEFRGSWEDRFTYAAVKEMYIKAMATGEVSSFNQEMMLRIMSEEDRLIQESDLMWFERKLILRNKANFNFFITTDIATSEKQHADFSFVSVWAMNHKGDLYWVDGHCARQTIDKTFDVLFRFAHIYNPMSVGIEVSGQQEGLLTLLQQEMMRKNMYFPLASSGNGNRPGIRPNTNKLQRFNNVVPLFKRKKIYFPTDLKGDVAYEELYNEVSLACAGGFKSKHDDALDTISMLSMMDLFEPSEPMMMQEDGGGVYFVNDHYDGVNSLSSYIV